MLYLLISFWVCGKMSKMKRPESWCVLCVTFSPENFYSSGRSVSECVGCVCICLSLNLEVTVLATVGASDPLGSACVPPATLGFRGTHRSLHWAFFLGCWGSEFRSSDLVFYPLNRLLVPTLPPFKMKKTVCVWKPWSQLSPFVLCGFQRWILRC